MDSPLLRQIRDVLAKHEGQATHIVMSEEDFGMIMEMAATPNGFKMADEAIKNEAVGEWIGAVADTMCGRCGHYRSAHDGPCRDRTCDGLRMCMRFVEASTSITP